MAFLIYPSLTGISRRTGSMFGEGKVKIVTYRCLLFTIITMDVRHMGMFLEFMRANMTMKEWLIENAPAVREHKRRAIGRARKQADSDAADRLDFIRQARDEATEKLHESRQENYRLMQTVTTLTGLKK